MTLEEAKMCAAHINGCSKQDGKPTGKGEVWSAQFYETTQQMDLIARVHVEGCTPQLDERLVENSVGRLTGACSLCLPTIK
jgi:hypothetical protein